MRGSVTAFRHFSSIALLYVVLLGAPRVGSCAIRASGAGRCPVERTPLPRR